MLEIKRLCSVLLMVMLILSSFSVLSASAQEVTIDELLPENSASFVDTFEVVPEATEDEPVVAPRSNGGRG